MDAKAKVVAYLAPDNEGRNGGKPTLILADECVILRRVLEPLGHKFEGLIPLTDHEAALADARRTAEYWKAEHLAGNARLDALLSGLEALAGEWERSGDLSRDSDGYAGYAGKVYDECAEKLQALISSAGLEGKGNG